MNINTRPPSILCPCSVTGECNHPNACSTCSLRQRQLNRDIKCFFCKAENHAVIYTIDKKRRFEDYDLRVEMEFDRELGVYSTRRHLRQLKELSAFVCTHPSGCSFFGRDLPSLCRHYEGAHGVFTCSICLEHRPVFVSELDLFTPSELALHNERGGEGGHKGHPKCEFCNKRFYNDQALFLHMKEKHFSCGICDSMSESLRYQYYVNYESLETHFFKSHFACKDGGCRAQRFVVYGDELSLMAHNANVHGVRDQAVKLDFKVKRDGSRGGGRERERDRIDFDASVGSLAADMTAALTLNDFPSLGDTDRSGVVSIGGSSGYRSVVSNASITENDFPSLPSSSSAPRSSQKHTATKKKPSGQVMYQTNQPKAAPAHRSKAPPKSAAERAAEEAEEFRHFGRQTINNVYVPPPSFTAAVQPASISLVSSFATPVSVPAPAPSRFAKPVLRNEEDFPSLPAPSLSAAPAPVGSKLKNDKPLGNVVLHIPAGPKPKPKPKKKNELRDLAMVRR